MDKANMAFAFIFILPAAIIAVAFLFIIPSAMAGVVPVPTITSTKYVCGDCTNAWSAECRTLYRIDSYSNLAKSVSPVKTAPQSDYTYCYNGQFVKINFKESYKCSGNTSYKSLDSTGLPSGFKWSYGMDWPAYCAYGCNKATGKCKSTQAQVREIDPNNPQLGPNEPPLITPFRTTMPKPTPTVKPAEKQAAKTCVPTNYLVCKNGDSYRRYIYRDCSQAEFLSTDCGSCQACSGGQCTGKASGCILKPAARQPAQASCGCAGTKRSASCNRQCDANPIVTSNYGRLYSQGQAYNSTCTYNSECPSGYYCKRLSGGNACRPRN
jgi:hypothetical protein